VAKAKDKIGYLHDAARMLRNAARFVDCAADPDYEQLTVGSRTKFLSKATIMVNAALARMHE
jgi:hypothetical protein